MVKGQICRGYPYRQKVLTKTKNLTPEQIEENLKEKQRRLAETLGWNNNWLHDKPQSQYQKEKREALAKLMERDKECRK